MRKIISIGMDWLRRRRPPGVARVVVQVRRATLPPQWERTLMPARKNAIP